MAVWHFKFALVPQDVIRKVHGGNVAVLPEYVVSKGGAKFVENAVFCNYWAGKKVSPETVGRVSLLLPEMESWSVDARMFGSDEGDRVEIWEDDFLCFLDVRNFSLVLLEILLSLAKDLSCKLAVVGSGEVVEPIVESVVDKIKMSNAYSFCMDPIVFLKSI